MGISSAEKRVMQAVQLADEAFQKAEAVPVPENSTKSSEDWVDKMAELMNSAPELPTDLEPSDVDVNWLSKAEALMNEAEVDGDANSSDDELVAKTIPVAGEKRCSAWNG